MKSFEQFIGELADFQTHHQHFDRNANVHLQGSDWATKQKVLKKLHSIVLNAGKKRNGGKDMMGSPEWDKVNKDGRAMRGESEGNQDENI